MQGGCLFIDLPIPRFTILISTKFIIKRNMSRHKKKKLFRQLSKLITYNSLILHGRKKIPDLLFIYNKNIEFFEKNLTSRLVTE